jgi:hypothetical protein
MDRDAPYQINAYLSVVEIRERYNVFSGRIVKASCSAMDAGLNRLEGSCEKSVVLVLGSGGYIFAELQKAIHVPFDRQRDDQLLRILFGYMEFI